MNESPFSYRFSFLCRISDLSNPLLLPQTVCQKPLLHFPAFLHESIRRPQQTGPPELCVIVYTYFVVFGKTQCLDCHQLAGEILANCDVNQNSSAGPAALLQKQEG